jgi:hypothetical protein
MIGKPSEFTKYKGHAYEIIFWENKRATPEKAFDQWRETGVARSLITNFKEWESHEWKALGIGIQEGFAIAWFGEKTDVEQETKICESGKIVKYEIPQKKVEQEIVDKPLNRCYLIFGSFSSLDDAKKQLAKYKEEGFKKAKVVIKDDKFRISLSDYANSELAAEAKKELPAKYKNVWVLTF